MRGRAIKVKFFVIGKRKKEREGGGQGKFVLKARQWKVNNQNFFDR